MQSFFSGTDTQELIDNCVNHSYYVSLIVNNRNEMVARIAIPGKKKVESSSTYSFSSILGKLINIPKKVEDEEDVMYYTDIEIEKEIPVTENLDVFFLDKVKELVNRPVVRPVEFFNFPNSLPQIGNGNFKQGDNNFRQKEIQKEIEFDTQEKTKEIEDLPIEKILVECLGGHPYQSISDILNDIMYEDGVTTRMEDVKFYLEQCLDQDTFSEKVQEYQRTFYEHPDLGDIKKVMIRSKNLLTHFVNGEFARVARAAISTIDKELTSINLILNR